MKLSVVISTYNGERYIIEQLESIRTQTRTPDEVLIFDDCSSDDTVKNIIEYITSNGLEWCVSVNEKNKGWQRNFIEGISQAKGELIFTCDQDDVWDSNKLDIMEKVMEEHPNISLLVSRYREFYGDYIPDYSFEDITSISKIKLDNNFFTVLFPGCTYCIRKVFFDTILPYWQEGFPHDAFIWRFAIFSDSLYVCEKKLFNWRKHSSSAVAIETNRKKKLVDRKGWNDYAISFSEILIKYISDLSIDNNVEKKRLLEEFIKWLKKRNIFFETGNPIKGLILIKYLKFYRDFKQFLGDYYTVYFRR